MLLLYLIVLFHLSQRRKETESKLLLSTFFKRGTRRDNWYSKYFCNVMKSARNGGATNGVGTGLLLPMLERAIEIIFIENCAEDVAFSAALK